MFVVSGGTHDTLLTERGRRRWDRMASLVSCWLKRGITMDECGRRLGMPGKQAGIIYESVHWKRVWKRDYDWAHQ